LTGRPSDAVRMITSGLRARPVNRIDNVDAVLLSHLARAHIELGKFEDAWVSIGEALTGGRSKQGKVVRSRFN
jgi:hypothetical protein